MERTSPYNQLRSTYSASHTAPINQDGRFHLPGLKGGHACKPNPKEHEKMAREQSRLPALRGRQQGLTPFMQDDLLSPSLFFETSPFQLMRRMQEDLNRMFGSALGPASEGLGSGQGMQIWSPTVDV